MKTLFLYESKCGSTQKYATDMAEQVQGEAFPLKHFKAKKMLGYDTIVFGGWVMGGTIQGLDKFLSDYKLIEKKNVIIFSVGLSIPTQESRHLMIEQNLLDLYHVRFYQLRGSFDMKKVRFPYNILLKNSLQMMLNDPTTPDKEALESLKTHPIDVYDSEKVGKIVSVLNQLAAEPQVTEVASEDKK
jgi:menaquinone-dependent protoporphyrinogen IX oxidase